MTLLEKYEQLRDKVNKVWYYYHWNNRTSLKYEKSYIIWYKIDDIINK